VSAPVLVGPSSPGGGPAPSLSEVELAVLVGVANGQTYRIIAKQINYTYKSVKEVGVRVLRKLGAEDMPHAVFLACGAGILDPKRRHGDHAGFAAHKYHEEEPCEACWEGERAYRRERRAARRASAA